MLGLAGQAQASVILDDTTVLPKDHFTAPVATTGKVLDVMGTARLYKSPFSDTTSRYLAIVYGTATYLAPSLTHEVSLVWGTPDKYNSVLFFNGSKEVDSYQGGSFVKGKVQYGYFTTLRTTEAFDKVEFVSTDYSFELSNVAFSTVPLPAAAPLFGAGLLLIAGIGYGLNRRATPRAGQIQAA